MNRMCLEWFLSNWGVVFCCILTGTFTTLGAAVIRKHPNIEQVKFSACFCFESIAVIFFCEELILTFNEVIVEFVESKAITKYI